ncbi:hypothetical protein QUF61_17660 [Candidatus Venteria ishoeyi]|uniref:hypothetical protein n=1 Tax=Candidatus Venteria ishoeyi TaxID=1899563 RepID=UPI0025A545D2|nr:hypothetical protein [Candidatus Venteria ishoeyi]MDM8548320.1 hypothetical protein [Candidatus Venteria ishoeyi]
MRNQQQRQQIAETAARIMAQESLDDFKLAKQKAVARLGLSQSRNLPDNQEIEQALRTYQKLFYGQEQSQWLTQQRHTALQAMKMLQSFEPCLVGKVLSGTSHEYSTISLHVFCDTQEEIAWLLMEQNIPYEISERLYPGIERKYPCYRFMAGETRLSLTVFPYAEKRQAPPDPVTGKPMQRMTEKKLKEMIAENG